MIKYPKIDYQQTIYYSAPKPKLKSLDEVDPELLAIYDKLGVPLAERARACWAWSRHHQTLRWMRVFDSVFSYDDVQAGAGRQGPSSSVRSARPCIITPIW